MKIQFLCICFFLFINAGAQNNFRAVVKDSATKEPLSGVMVSVSNTALKGTTNEKGMVIIHKIPDGRQEIVFSSSRNRKTTLTYDFPLSSKKTITILLAVSETDLDVIVVNTTRINSPIEDSPTRIKVISGEKMDEATTLSPATVSDILANLSAIRVQRTNQLNGNEVVRMQGLDSRYTSIMRDGMPVYDGYSGSLGLLSVPPLDVKQVEIINGPVSALYGNGAIGGVINFISKTPTTIPEATLTANVTSRGEGNVNAFTSGKNNKTGYTLFGSFNSKQAVDINGDGFAEVPKCRSFIIHPTLFYDANPKTKIILGFSTTFDNRVGGDIQAIDFGTTVPHPFVQEENTYRNTLDVSMINKHSQKHTFTLKSTGSAFERDVNYSGFVFNGTQYATYSELNDVMKWKKNTLVAGVNFVSANLKLFQNDAKYFGNRDDYTAGLFMQDDWYINKKFSIEAGIRYNYNFTFHSFILPRLSVLYKPKTKILIRLAGGSGYKTPDMFDLTEPSPYIHPIIADLKPENANGANADINYHTMLFHDLNVQLEQSLFYVSITNPVILTTDSTKNSYAANGNYITNSYGTNTSIRLKLHDVELMLAYNHSESVLRYDTMTVNTPFNPKDKFVSRLSYTIENEWKFAVETSFTANQYTYNNNLVNDFWMVGAMVEKKFNYGSIVLNFKNILDQRQSKYETLVDGTKQNPVFKPVWSSLDGRVINLCLKITL